MLRIIKNSLTDSAFFNLLATAGSSSSPSMESIEVIDRATPECFPQELYLELSGKAFQKWRSYGGKYVKQNGWSQDGRPVWVKGSYQLKYHKRINEWLIGPDNGGTKIFSASYSSSSSNLRCPVGLYAPLTWSYRNGDSASDKWIYENTEGRAAVQVKPFKKGNLIYYLLGVKHLASPGKL